MVSQYNAVLKTWAEVEEAVSNLQSIGLFPHHGREKSWDAWKIIDIIKKDGTDSYILDVGCNGSPILPMLRKLGFSNLYGCDLTLQPRYPKAILKLYSSLFLKEYTPVLDMLSNPSFKLSIQSLEKTNYSDSMFDYITSVSVIEHGVNINNYFREMNRILKLDGLLLTSTDYWPEKIINTVKVLSQDRPDNIFSRKEIDDVVKVAEANGFALTEPIDYSYKDKVVHWNKTGLDYTFIFFALKKIRSTKT